jgi:hypothetical protein
MNKTQQKLFEEIKAQEERGLPVRIIILKARQEGISTFIAARLYFRTICIPNTASAIIADLDANAQQLFEIYRRFYESSPEDLKPCKKYDRRDRGTVFDELQSRIDILVATEAKNEVSGRTGRSRTYQNVHCSEYAFWANARATMNALNQTIPEKEGTEVYIESTANTWGDDFFSAWERAKEGKSDYQAVFFPWWFHLEYATPCDEQKQQEIESTLGTAEDAEFGNERYLLEEFKLSFAQLHWRRRTIANKCSGSLQTFKREYPSFAEEAFQTAGEYALDQNALVYFSKEVQNPLWVGDINKERHLDLTETPTGFLKIWEEPEPYTEYIIGSDHAQGLDWGDFNYAVVIRRLPLQVVATLAGHDGRRIQPDEFGLLMAWLGEYYHWARICPESNNDGGKAITVLQMVAKYPKLIYEDAHLRLSKTKRVGWMNNAATRKLLISELQEAIKQRAITIQDSMIINCAKGFVYVNGKPQAVKKGEKRVAGESLWQYIDCPLFALGSALLAHNRLPPPKPQEVIKNDYRHPRTLKRMQQAKAQKGILAYV